MSRKPEHAHHRLIVQPDDGAEPVLELLGEARRTLRTVQFTLDDPRFVQAVLDAHRRGVKVQVLLNPRSPRGNVATTRASSVFTAPGCRSSGRIRASR